MPIVTTEISPKTLTASYDADGVTVNGLKVNYTVTLFHDGVKQPDPITKSVDVWAGLSGGAKAKVQEMFDGAKTLLDG
jgi:hypothetical protein|tara:strand:+ start:1456 stop:1689 length:234 start_codon:yes stop_codon:yes gene_type:complete